MKFNDLDLKNWKNLEIETDSLWLIKERDKSGKHKNIYHGNFIPQIPNQLIQRFTQNNDVVLEPFMGSGTTLFECENLNRKYIGFDINPEMLSYVNDTMRDSQFSSYHIGECDSMNAENVNYEMENAKQNLQINSAQFVLMHPPYMDIVKFTDKKEDMSQISDINKFVNKFKVVCDNTLKYLDNDRYFAIVIGDLYKKGEVLPLGFYCMDMIKRNFNVKLKGIIIKNIEGNRAKLGQGGIWKYRALNSDYYIFKHEYIYVFKKEV